MFQLVNITKQLITFYAMNKFDIVVFVLAAATLVTSIVKLCDKKHESIMLIDKYQVTDTLKTK